MNKFTSLLSSLIIACAMPMMAQTYTTSGVSGTATENNGAVYQQSFGLPSATWTGESIGIFSSSFGIGGSQSETSSFYAQPVNTCSGEDANGSSYVSGNTSTQGGYISGNNTTGSWVSGFTNNSGSVFVTENGGTGSSANMTAYLSGSGSMTSNTSALIGNFTVGSDGYSPVNGAFAQSSTSGSFNFTASVTGSGTIGTWSGNGSTTQTGYSQVFNLGNGYSATSSASVISVACPVKK